MDSAQGLGEGFIGYSTDFKLRYNPKDNFVPIMDVQSRFHRSLQVNFIAFNNDQRTFCIELILNIASDV